jgi:hypothetical protein
VALLLYLMQATTVASSLFAPANTSAGIEEVADCGRSPEAEVGAAAVVQSSARQQAASAQQSVDAQAANWHRTANGDAAAAEQVGSQQQVLLTQIVSCSQPAQRAANKQEERCTRSPPANHARIPPP